MRKEMLKANDQLSTGLRHQPFDLSMMSVTPSESGLRIHHWDKFARPHPFNIFGRSTAWKYLSKLMGSKQDYLENKVTGETRATLVREWMLGTKGNLINIMFRQSISGDYIQVYSLHKEVKGKAPMFLEDLQSMANDELCGFWEYTGCFRPERNFGQASLTFKLRDDYPGLEGSFPLYLHIHYDEVDQGKVTATWSVDLGGNIVSSHMIGIQTVAYKVDSGYDNSSQLFYKMGADVVSSVEENLLKEWVGVDSAITWVGVNKVLPAKERDLLRNRAELICSGEKIESWIQFWTLVAV